MIGIVAVVVLVSTAFQAIAGFGFAIVAAPVLVTILGVKETVKFIIISSAYMQIYMMHKVRKDVHFDVVKRLLIGSILGILPGSYIFRSINAQNLEILLGISLIMAVTLLSFKFSWHSSHPKLEQVLFGLVAGFFIATTSIGGPVISLYMLNAKAAKDETRADMTFFFFASNLWTLTTWLFLGNISWSYFVGLPLWNLPASVLGVYVGNIIFQHVNQKMFNRLSMLVILFCGIHMIMQGLGK